MSKLFKVDTTANRLKIILEQKDMTQTDLLRRCEMLKSIYNIKMSKSDISQFVNGKHEPRQDKLFLLGEALGVSPNWLMGLDVDQGGNPIERVEYHSQRMIRVFGRVAAGQPIEAIEEYLDTIPLSPSMNESEEYYGLKIDGDSMEPNILYGDYVIVRKQDYAEDGDIIIALVDGKDATCKLFRKHQNGISLVSLNPKYAPMFFTAKEVLGTPVRIIGKVVELRRSI